MKKTILLILPIILVFILYGCIGGSSCSDNSQCENWQFCNVSKGICAAKEGYCQSNSGCNDTLLECDTNSTHTCVYKTDKCRSDANCKKWQVCDASNNCQPKPGYCSKHSQCNATYQICDSQKHKCTPKAGFCEQDFDCKGWEKCDAKSKKCSTIKGRCNNDADCDAWEKCYIDEYKDQGLVNVCFPKNPGVVCTSDYHCDTTWQKCDRTIKKCIPRQGYCDTDNRCNSWEYCDLTDHKCTSRPDMCNTAADCNSWEYCTSQHNCKAKLGYCTVDNDCASGVCNEKTHTCQ